MSDQPDRSAGELRAALEQSQAELQDALGDLEARARSEIDIGRRIAEHAPIVLGISFAIGLALGLRRSRIPVP